MDLIFDWGQPNYKSQYKLVVDGGTVHVKLPEVEKTIDDNKADYDPLYEYHNPQKE